MNFSDKSLKQIFYGILALGSLLLLVATNAVVLPSDEPIDKAYGEACLKYYKSFGKDKSFADLTVMERKFPVQKYYGAGFEAPSVFISNLLFPSNVYKGRHFLVALVGIGIIWILSLMAKDFGGWQLSIIVALLMFTSPTFIGNSMFNSKDIPFAFGFLLTFYFFFKMVSDFPNFKIINAAGAGLGMALASSIRVGSVIIIPFLFLLIGLAFFESWMKSKKKPKKKSKKKKSATSGALGIKQIMTWTGRVVAIVVLGFIGGMLMYPNFFESPLTHVTTGLTIASKFPSPIKFMFEEKIIQSTELPWYYLFKYIWLSFPILITMGILTYFGLIKKMIEKHGVPLTVTIASLVLFPFVIFLVARPNIYNGWRHFMFFFPFCVLATGLVIQYILNSKNLILLTFAGTLIAIPTLVQSVWMVQNTPFQYTYFNFFTGGVQNFYGRYDVDYQQLATGSALKWLINSDQFKNHPNQEIKIASNNGNSLKNVPTRTDKNYEVFQTSYQGYVDMYWDFAILSPQFLTRDLLEVSYPPNNAIHHVTIGNIPIATIVQRISYDDYNAVSMIKEGNPRGGLALARKYYQTDPNNHRILFWIGYAEYQTGEIDNALSNMEVYANLYPMSYPANLIMGNIYTQQGRYAEAEKKLKLATAIKPREKGAYNSLERLYRTIGNISAAEQTVEKRKAKTGG